MEKKYIALSNSFKAMFDKECRRLEIEPYELAQLLADGAAGLKAEALVNNILSNKDNPKTGLSPLANTLRQYAKALASAIEAEHGTRPKKVRLDIPVLACWLSQEGFTEYTTGRRTLACAIAEAFPGSKSMPIDRPLLYFVGKNGKLESHRPDRKLRVHTVNIEP